MSVSFPNSTKSWTPLVDTVSDMIANDVNTLYEEVNAIETKLKEGADGNFLGISSGVPTWQTVVSESTNVETLSGTKTLLTTDATYQLLNHGGANRIVNLPTGNSSCFKFKFRYTNNNSTNYYIEIQYNSTRITKMYQTHEIYEVIWNGTTWIPGTSAGDYIAIGNGANAWSIGGGGNVAIGKDAVADNVGISIGNAASAYTEGLSIGASASSNTYSIAIGRSAIASNRQVSVGYGATGGFWHYGVSVGHQAVSSNGGYGGAAIGEGAKSYNGIALNRQADTNSQNTAMAFGYYAKCQRWNEIHYKFDYNNSSNNRRTWSVLQWQGQTTNDTQTEIFLGGTSNKRTTILAKSLVNFSIKVSAFSSTYEAMTWKIEGSIRRDASNNTTLVGTPTVTTLGNTDANSWAPVVEADDTNEALVLKVTGEAATTINWHAVVDLTDIEI